MPNLKHDSLYRLITALASKGWDRDRIITMLSPSVAPHMISALYPDAHRLAERRAVRRLIASIDALEANNATK